MSRVIPIVAILALTSFAGAQESEAKTPSTKLEAFSSRTGVVLIKGFTELGSVAGRGRVAVDVKEIRDAGNPKSARYGVTVEVKESGRLERESRSFIDEDEIDSLIRGIEYVAKVGKVRRGVTTFQNFEAQYSTKGDLSVTVFTHPIEGTILAFASGRVGAVNAFVQLEDAEKLKLLLEEAKRLIANAKAAPVEFTPNSPPR